MEYSNIQKLEFLEKKYKRKARVADITIMTLAATGAAGGFVAGTYLYNKINEQ